MKLNVLRSACAMAAVALASGLSSTGAYAGAISDVYVFGDSLSDNGNFYAITAALPGGPYPQAPYQQRLSNGPVAVEVMADALGATLHDYAFAGATTTTLNGALQDTANNPILGPFVTQAMLNTGLLAQLAMFTATLNPVTPQADSNALYVVWAGPNDFKYLGFSGATFSTAIQDLAGSVGYLYSLGARKFLLPGMPDLGLTPGGLASGASAQLSGFSAQFDATLKGTYDYLQSLMPDATLTWFDTLQTQRDLAGAAQGQFTNVTEACFSGFVGVPGTECGNPSNYMFWDTEHPTEAMHSVIGRAFASAVPEPGSMLLVATAVLGMLGASRRRR